MVSYIYTFTKPMAIKPGRVMTYSEGCKITRRGHMKSREGVRHTVDVISTFYLHRRHMTLVYRRMILLLRIFKNIKAKSKMRSVRMRS